MIVEDDEDFVYLVQKLLKKHKDIEVTVAGPDQEKVLSKVVEEHTDIVLMDLNLGVSNLDGIRLSREIRIRTDAKVLILTALETPDMIFKAAEEAHLHRVTYSKARCLFWWKISVRLRKDIPRRNI